MSGWLAKGHVDSGRVPNRFDLFVVVHHSPWNGEPVIVAFYVERYFIHPYLPLIPRQ